MIRHPATGNGTAHHLGSYVLFETAVGIGINVLLATVPAAFGAGNPGSCQAAIPAQLFAAAFMSALVPSLVARHRRRTGRLGGPSGASGPSIAAIALMALTLAPVSAPLAWVITRAGLRWATGGACAALWANAVSGGLAATFITPAALIFMSLSWSRRECCRGEAADRLTSV